MLTQVHVFIKGDVIGVGFRAWTKIQAKMNNVTGWVRNVYDEAERYGQLGRVEVLLQGEKSNVEKMVELVREGPTVARVDEVEVIQEEPKEVYKEFEIRS